MDTIIQNQLDRLETTLDTLIDSIASYNPSIPAATDLVNADDDLNKGIIQCMLNTHDSEELPSAKFRAVTTHQTNHARILHLRKTIENLNQTISSNLTLLADTRKELLATPATTFSEDQRNVPYNELLDYAKRISKYTVPPTFRPPPLGSQTTSVAVPQPANPSTNGAPEQKVAQDLSTVSSNNNEVHGEGIGVASLDQGDMRWLDPLKQIPFVPWPSEEVIRQGALAHIQAMLDQNIDPSNADVSGNKVTKHEIDTEAEVGEISSDEVARGITNAVKGNAENGIVKAEKRDEKPKVFGGLDLYDPDEE